MSFPATLTDALSWRQAAREAPELEALRWSSQVWSFRDLGALVAETAEELRAQGAGPGVAVALKAENGLRALAVAAATLELGATLVLLHPRLTAGEEKALLEEARPRVLVAERSVASLPGAASLPKVASLSGLPKVVSLPGAASLPEATSLSEIASLPEVVSLPGAAAFPEQVGVVMFTSGTSGKPKGAQLSRRALIAAAQASAENLPVRPGDRWLLCLPLCHIGGLSILLRCLLGRGSVVLAPRFRADEVLALIAEHRPTLLSVVPTMLHALLEADRGNLLASLRAVLVGGAAAAPALLERCASRGVLALTTYGLTEACSQVTTQRPRDPATTEPGVGFPLPGVTLRLVDEDGTEVAPGAVGRLLVRGPALMDGYLHGEPLRGGVDVVRREPLEGGLDAVCGEPPQRGLDAVRGEPPGGWLDTGDLGSLDEHGRLHLHARRTDLIVTGGENVYPAEIEAWLLARGGVAEAMVFGVPDPVWGQLVAVALVPGAGFDLDALRAALTAELAAHKRPRRYLLTTALPVGSTGKPLRRRALDLFAADLQPL